eukprot:CAMPEP_0202705218 /NCGR_PEP_ID=MMETSP1385-20130828/17806_1 /ASSEMBLY_ACC=CAM_ASM_000861 /TAXON_ID=933848 /ORGANISM="Elphidium margaritaceum" /LENGTH=144 /DNA_ID=CAMNT_0049363407 /DNA_START=38 /DNA_END=472 /DNA_ORIENTATION=+
MSFEEFNKFMEAESTKWENEREELENDPVKWEAHTKQIDAKVESFVKEEERKRKRRENEVDVVSGLVGLAAVGVGALLTAEKIKADLANSGQAEYGIPQPQLLKKCDWTGCEEMVKGGGFCNEHGAAVSHMVNSKPQNEDCIVM